MTTIDFLKKNPGSELHFENIYTGLEDVIRYDDGKFQKLIDYCIDSPYWQVINESEKYLSKNSYQVNKGLIMINGDMVNVSHLIDDLSAEKK